MGLRIDLRLSHIFVNYRGILRLCTGYICARNIRITFNVRLLLCCAKIAKTTKTTETWKRGHGAKM